MLFCADPTAVVFYMRQGSNQISTLLSNLLELSVSFKKKSFVPLEGMIFNAHTRTQATETASSPRSESGLPRAWSHSKIERLLFKPCTTHRCVATWMLCGLRNRTLFSVFRHLAFFFCEVLADVLRFFFVIILFIVFAGYVNYTGPRDPTVVTKENNFWESKSLKGQQEKKQTTISHRRNERTWEQQKHKGGAQDLRHLL